MHIPHLAANGIKYIHCTQIMLPLAVYSIETKRAEEELVRIQQEEPGRLVESVGEIGVNCMCT